MDWCGRVLPEEKHFSFELNRNCWLHEWLVRSPGCLDPTHQLLRISLLLATFSGLDYREKEVISFSTLVIGGFMSITQKVSFCS